MTRQVRGNRTRGEVGATATEYGILVLFIALALVVGVALFGQNLGEVYSGLAQWVADNLKL